MSYARAVDGATVRLDDEDPTVSERLRYLAGVADDVVGRGEHEQLAALVLLGERLREIAATL